MIADKIGKAFATERSICIETSAILTRIRCAFALIDIAFASGSFVAFADAFRASYQIDTGASVHAKIRTCALVDIHVTRATFEARSTRAVEGSQKVMTCGTVFA